MFWFICILFTCVLNVDLLTLEQDLINPHQERLFKYVKYVPPPTYVQSKPYLIGRYRPLKSLDGIKGKYIEKEHFNRHAENLNNQPEDSSSKTECPPHATGQFAYAMDCRQFLNCWRGKGYIQSCAPGTLFNSITKECDYPSKVKCPILPAKFEQIRIVPPASSSFISKTHDNSFEAINLRTIKAECKKYIFGLHAHPYDCTKFLNCANGVTYIQSCGPGTVFNSNLKVCDWPRNVKCQNESLDINKTVDPILHREQIKNKEPSLAESSEYEYIHPKEPIDTNQKLVSKNDSSKASQIPDLSSQFGEKPNQTQITLNISRKEDKYVFARSTELPINKNVGPYRAHSIFPSDLLNKLKAQSQDSSKYPSTIQSNLLTETSTVNTVKESYIKKSVKIPETQIVNSTIDLTALSEAIKALLQPYAIKEQSSVMNNVARVIENKLKSTVEITTTANLNEAISIKNDELKKNQTFNNQNQYKFEAIDGINKTDTILPKPLQKLANKREQYNVKSNAEEIKFDLIDSKTNIAAQKPFKEDANYKHGNLKLFEVTTHQLHYLNVYTESSTPHYTHVMKTSLPKPSDEFKLNVENTIPISTSTTNSIGTNFSTNTITSICGENFDCQNGMCLQHNKVCDGRNDCGNRLDEKNCNHIGYEVRLSGDDGSTSKGRVEVKVFDKWGYVCDDQFGMTEATVLCRELGFQYGAAEVLANSYYLPNSNMTHGKDTVFIMDNLKCIGNETSLKECNFNGWGVHDCNAEEVVGVSCKDSIQACPINYWHCDISEQCIPISFLCDNINDCSDNSDEDIRRCNSPLEYRLVNGNDLEGNVEVRYQGIWGTICDDDFGPKEATVICKSLGLGGHGIVIPGSTNNSTGPIWLDQVSCFGNESTIADCMHFDWGEHNCNHSEDVSIRCSTTLTTVTPRLTTQKPIIQKLHRFTDIPKKDEDSYMIYNERSSKITSLDTLQCGKVKVADDLLDDVPTFRVLTGNKAKKGHHPWQATIRVKARNGKSSHWCGAVLISKYHLLTAAHCLIGFEKGAYFIRLGDHNSEILENTEKDSPIENWYIHEDFRKEQHMNNDIAVIKLKFAVTFSDHIQPVCLPEKTTVYAPGMQCTISGWGTILYGTSTHSLDLRAATVPILANNICKNPEVYGNSITDGMFCAGYLSNEGIDACDGDSGGPLVCQNNDTNTLYGIISWGYRCGNENKPGVYVKVTHYLDWINDKINRVVK